MQISSMFLSLRHNIRSAEKYKRSGDPELTFTQFHKSFPKTSEGAPGLNVASSPIEKQAWRIC